MEEDRDSAVLVRKKGKRPRTGVSIGTTIRGEKKDGRGEREICIIFVNL